MIYSGAAKASKASRAFKAKVRGAHPIETKVREATTSEAWGPTGTQLRELAAASYDSRESFEAIFRVLEERLDERGSKWRKCSKALQVIDYLMKVGHPSCCNPIRIGIMHVKIQEIKNAFRYTDPATGKDIGSIVRGKADELLRLANDEELLAEERERARSTTRQISGHHSGHVQSTAKGSHQTYNERSPRRYPSDNYDRDSGRKAVVAPGNIVMHDPVTPKKPASVRTGEDRYYGGNFGVEVATPRGSEGWQSSGSSQNSQGPGKKLERAHSTDLWPPSPVHKANSPVHPAAGQPVYQGQQQQVQPPVQQPLHPPRQQPLPQPPSQVQGRIQQQTVPQPYHSMQRPDQGPQRQQQKLIYMQGTAMPQQFGQVQEKPIHSRRQDNRGQFNGQAEQQLVDFNQGISGFEETAEPVSLYTNKPGRPAGPSSLPQYEPPAEVAQSMGSWHQKTNAPAQTHGVSGPASGPSKSVNPFSSTSPASGESSASKSTRKKLEWEKANSYLNDLGQGKVKLSLDNLSISSGLSPAKRDSGAEKSMPSIQAQSNYSYMQPADGLQPFAAFRQDGLAPANEGSPSQGSARGLRPPVAPAFHSNSGSFADGGFSQNSFF